MSGYIQSNQTVLLPDSAYTVSAADTGKIMLVSTVTGDRTITLPAAAPGLHYRFINKAPGALGGNVIVQGAAAGLLNGLIIQLGAAVAATRSLAVTAALSMTFVTAVSVKGDHMDFYCDGTNWSVSAMTSVLGGITTP